MIANRRRPGTTSRKSSSRLAARSAAWFDRPVMLPPGRARLATRPVPSGSVATANTIGMTEVACFAATTEAPAVTMRSTFSRNELGCDLGVALVASFCPPILDRHVATLNPAEFAQSLHKGADPCTPECRRGPTQEPDCRELPRLLRL